jgi:hypothetical protein
MTREFIPKSQASKLKKLGYNIPPVHEDNILYQQAFRWLRDTYGFTYSIGRYNHCVLHGKGTTFVIENKTFEEAEQSCLKRLIELTNH